MESQLSDWQSALNAAVQSPDSANISRLVLLLNSSEVGEVARQQVAEALGQINHPEAIQALLNGAVGNDPLLKGLCAMGLAFVPTAESVECLLRLLADETNKVRNLAERSLLLLSDAVREFGVNQLLTLIEHPVALTRSPAARLLGITQDARGYNPLVTHLKSDSQWLVRMWSAKGLGDMGHAAAFEPLFERIRHDEKNRVRAAAVEAIGKLNHSQTEEAFTVALRDDDEGVRKHAEEALATLRRTQLGHDQPDEHHEPHFADE